MVASRTAARVNRELRITLPSSLRPRSDQDGRGRGQGGFFLADSSAYKREQFPANSCRLMFGLVPRVVASLELSRLNWTLTNSGIISRP